MGVAKETQITTRTKFRSRSSKPDGAEFASNGRRCQLWSAAVREGFTEEVAICLDDAWRVRRLQTEGVGQGFPH